MQADDKKVLAQVRLDRAKECLAEAEDLYEAEKYRGAANRLYYSVFHAMRAVLALDGVDMKHHSGIISEFRRRFIKTNIFDVRLSGIISALYEMRSESDYDDFYVLSKNDIADQIINARYFIDSIESFLKSVT
ncbi:MAG: HEPN domain-containing protein [Ruminococcus sp.]|nr:HEPN domain-containing protein [Ruminococcus sp.]